MGLASPLLVAGIVCLASSSAIAESPHVNRQTELLQGTAESDGWIAIRSAAGRFSVSIPCNDNHYYSSVATVPEDEVRDVTAQCTSQRPAWNLTRVERMSFPSSARAERSLLEMVTQFKERGSVNEIQFKGHPATKMVMTNGIQCIQQTAIKVGNELIIAAFSRAVGDCAAIQADEARFMNSLEFDR